MPAPRLLHRGSHCRIRQPRSSTQIFRGKRQEMVILHDSRHLRRNSGCLLLYNPTVIYKHIQAWSRTRPCHCFPLFRSGDQYFINYPNGSHLGCGDGYCPYSRSHHIFHCHRSSHVIHFPQGRKSQKRGTNEHHPTTGETPDVANFISLFHDGIHPCLRQLGSPCRIRQRIMVLCIYL